MSTVCLQEDDFTRECWLSNVRWTVQLSSGETVIQDDNRPGTTESAWMRLRAYLQTHNAHIVGMQLQFRNEPPYRLPDNAAGYFFRHGVGAYMSSGEVGPSIGFYLVGYLDGGKVQVTRFQVPEMIQDGPTQQRDPDDKDNVGPSLIMTY